MASLTDLARQHTSLAPAHVAHLQRLVAGWGMLADFCFADLLLFAPTRTGDRLVVLGQVRPATSQTLYVDDWVAGVVERDVRPFVSQALDSGEVTEGELELAGSQVRARVTAIPVHQDGQVVAVMTREWSPLQGRHAGELERYYLSIFERLARMITAGTFPFPLERSGTDAAPRVGDGVIILDARARVEYASPNATSALHRVGIQSNARGLRLGELGFDDQPVRTALEAMAPVTEELEQTGDVTLLVQCIPLLDEVPRPTGCVVLLRDITEVRRRDRMLLSKDATIREIHHRVKNNLQTISSLLRLQGRRVASPEAKVAIDESVRRIRAIALVHERLSRGAGEDVAFMDVLRPLARLAEESLQSPDRPVKIQVSGDGGKLAATVATPLAVVLTELLQNAVDHGFSGSTAVAGDDRRVWVELANDGAAVTVLVRDNGVGLPDAFELDRSSGLGLSIVRTLVSTELAGTIAMRTADGGGTVVELRIPVDPHSP